MGELIIKSNLSQDWISFALISNIVFIYLLVNLNPVRTSRLFNFLKIDFYLSKYNSERETQYLNLYNIIGTLLMGYLFQKCFCRGLFEGLPNICKGPSNFLLNFCVLLSTDAIGQAAVLCRMTRSHG